MLSKGFLHYFVYPFFIVNYAIVMNHYFLSSNREDDEAISYLESRVDGLEESVCEFQENFKKKP